MLECLTDVLCTYATAIVEDSLNRKTQAIKKMKAGMLKSYRCL